MSNQAKTYCQTRALNLIKLKGFIGFNSAQFHHSGRFKKGEEGNGAEQEEGGDNEDDYGEDTEGKEEEEEDGIVTLQTQNITELLENYTFLIDDKVDINFMQECKVKEAGKGKMEK